jgi:hypothetical protein
MKSSILNKKHTRDYILNIAQEMRPEWGPTRVSAVFLDDLEYKFRRTICRAIRAHPSSSKTVNQIL